MTGSIDANASATIFTGMLTAVDLEYKFNALAAVDAPKCPKTKNDPSSGVVPNTLDFFSGLMSLAFVLKISKNILVPI